MELTELTRWLDETLSVSTFDDTAFNGLQVEAGPTVERIAVAVDASTQAIEQAAQAHCDLLVCHHGLLWGRPRPMVGSLARKLSRMFERGVSLYAAHLPLDAHPQLGNNARLAAMLELVEREPFGTYRGQKIGFMGRLSRPQPVEDVVGRLGAMLDGLRGSAFFGGSAVSRVGVVSGAAGDMVPEAISAGLDLLVTGEIDHASAVMARDCAFNLAFLGHWATETLGVKAVGEAIEEHFGLPWVTVGESTGF